MKPPAYLGMGERATHRKRNKKLTNFLAVAGKPREKLDLEEGATVKDILASAKVSRHSGEILVIGDREVGDDYVPADGETIVYVPPVGLGD